MSLLIVAVLVKRLGGHVVITQSEIDDVAYNRLEERLNEDHLKLQLVTKPHAH